EHHDDGSPHTYVPCVGLAADGSVATDRSPPVYRLVLTVSASVGPRCLISSSGRRVRTNVDAPAGQLGGEPGILALLADSQRQLEVRDDHPGGTQHRVDDL